MDLKEAKAKRKAALETPTNLGSNATRDLSGCSVVIVEEPATDVIVVLGGVNKSHGESAIGVLSQVQLGPTRRSGFHSDVLEGLEIGLGHVALVGIEEHPGLELKRLGRHAFQLHLAVGIGPVNFVHLAVLELFAVEKFGHLFARESNAGMVAKVKDIQATVFLCIV